MLNRILKPLLSFNNASFQRLEKRKEIYLYAGDLGSHTRNGLIPFIGLSLTKSDRWHIKHDVRKKVPLPDSSVSIYQSEDVFEHLEYDGLLPIINEIFRILKPSGLFRLSLPDYRCDVLVSRAVKDDAHRIIFDPAGGGEFFQNKVINGGHLWFPTYELVAAVLNQSEFARNGEIRFLHYYDMHSQSITEKIDHSKGMVWRTPDYDKRVQSPLRAMSIVVDLIKS